MTQPNDCFSYFSQGVLLILQRWTALQICIQQGITEPQSSNKTSQLHLSIVQYFKDNKNVTHDDLEDNFKYYFDDNFQTILEDGSAREVGIRLVSLYQSLALGNLQEFELLKRDRESGVVSSVIDIEQDSDEDDENMDSETEAMNDDNTIQETQKPRGPIIDEDGFTLVQKGRRTN